MSELPEATRLRAIEAAHGAGAWSALLSLFEGLPEEEARALMALLARQERTVLAALLDAVDGAALTWAALLPTCACCGTRTSGV